MKKYAVLLLAASCVATAQVKASSSAEMVAGSAILGSVGLMGSDAHEEVFGKKSPIHVGRLAAAGSAMGSLMAVLVQSVANKAIGGQAGRVVTSAALIAWLTTYGVEGKKSDKADTYKNVKRFGGLVGAAVGVAFMDAQTQLLQKFGVVPVAVLTAAMLAGRYGAQELAKRYHEKYPLKKAVVETIKN